MNHMIDTNKLKSQISEQEWLLRLELAATYRLIALYGWDDLIYTHVSLRIPGPEHHFLLILMD
jgi:ribulose-5-phosphate 4-epimerase/fuculose-1-phosphate aldolase